MANTASTSSFSKSARATVKKLVGGHEVVVQQLEQLLLDYAEVRGDFKYTTRQRAVDDQRLERVRVKCAQLLTRLGELSDAEFDRTAVLFDLAAQTSGCRTRISLAELRTGLSVYAGGLQLMRRNVLLDGRSAPRHRPKNDARRMLSFETAAILQRAGIPLAKSLPGPRGGGILAHVLLKMYAAAGEHQPAPESMMRILLEVCRVAGAQRRTMRRSRRWPIVIGKVERVTSSGRVLKVTIPIKSTQISVY